VNKRLHLLIAALLALALIGSAAPAHADPEDHGAGGQQGPTIQSQNIKLLSNVPKSTSATQSDLAFEGNLVYAGNYDGFRVIDFSEKESPVVTTDFRCPGAQGDVSVYRGLLFSSVDAPRSNDTCVSTPVSASTAGAWEGVRIFDVSDPTAPSLANAVRTDCGSHTNTIVPDGDTVYVYVSSYPLGTAALGPNCSQPHGFISIITVPVADPSAATVSKYHLDAGTETAVYPIGGGPFSFTACHDISVFTAIDRAAAACLSESQMWDISDPAHPQFVWRFDDPVVNTANIDLWHSSSFSWDGDVVAFGDESGGGGAARCADPTDQQGRIWFVDAESGTFLDNYKIPRSESGTCTMHNFNFVPLKGGRKVLVSSAYTGGTTVVDVDALLGGASELQAEIGFYRPHGGNAWSSYWYNGFIYANDILRGVDALVLADRTRAAGQKLPMLNPQTQTNLIR
jgi:hypothetical protein